MNTKRPDELRVLALLYQGRAEGAEDMRQLLMSAASKVPLALRERAVELQEHFEQKSAELHQAAERAEDVQAQNRMSYR